MCVCRELYRDIAGSKLIKPEFLISEYQTLAVATISQLLTYRNTVVKQMINGKSTIHFLYKADLLKRSWMSVKVTV